jgi:hypothetical protein
MSNTDIPATPDQTAAKVRLNLEAARVCLEQAIKAIDELDDVNERGDYQEIQLIDRDVVRALQVQADEVEGLALSVYRKL